MLVGEEMRMVEQSCFKLSSGGVGTRLFSRNRAQRKQTSKSVLVHRLWEQGDSFLSLGKKKKNRGTAEAKIIW